MRKPITRHVILTNCGLRPGSSRAPLRPLDNQLSRWGASWLSCAAGPIYTLLTRSLERIAPEDGIRLRLCLDEALIDFPWEFLYCPGTSRRESLAEFLVLDSRISLVRGAPTNWADIGAFNQSQRLVFAGMLECGDEDRQQVRPDINKLAEASPPRQAVSIDRIRHGRRKITSR